MNLIEEEIRMLLRSKVSQAPVKEEPPPVVLRRTRMMRGVNAVTAVAGAAAVIVGIVLGAQSLGSRPAVPPVGPVPWLPSPVPETISRTIEPCAAGDVASVRVLGDSIAFLARNSDVYCFIDPNAGLKLVVRDAAGPALPVTVRVGDSTPRAEVQGHTIHTAVLDYVWSNYCGPRPSSVIFDMTLPGGAGTFSTPLGPNALPGCTRNDVRSTLTFESSGAFDPPAFVDGSVPRQLVATIEVPPKVARGRTLAFVVTVLNQLDQPVDLDPCPEYQVVFQNETLLKSLSFGNPTLNCAGVPGGEIPGSGSVDFEMRIDVPADLEPGEWTLSWFLAPGGGDPAASLIRVI